MDLQGRAARLIAEYDSLGWHRTGTDVDHATARWLAGEVSATGLEADLEPFEFSRVDPLESYLEVDGQRVLGLPMFDAPFTGPEGVRGRLGPADSGADIGVVQIGVGPGRSAETFLAARVAGRYRALAGVTLGGQPGLAVRNAQEFLTAPGPPVVQLSSESGNWLARQAERGAEALLVCDAQRRSAEAYNVVAHIPGQQEGLPPIVVMTPYSGWWNGAGDRGGGIVCWLETIRALAATETRREVIFSATSGQEIGLLGLESFMKRRRELVTGAFVWLHFGAGIGASQESKLRFSAPDDEMERFVREALQEGEAGSVPSVARGSTTGLDPQVVQARGGRCIALAGGHALYHLEADRWPHAVDVKAIAGYARAFARVAVRLADGTPLS